MKVTRWKDLKKSRLSPEQIQKVSAQVKRDLLKMDLAELRQAAGQTQQDLAQVVKMTQSQLSRLEKRDDHLISTLRRYVKALGGDLEVVAVIGNQRISLHGV
jgi:DNA-binding XRE family transcriptional regulator